MSELQNKIEQSGALLNVSTNAHTQELNSESSKTYTSEKVQGTPFYLVEDDETKEVFISIANMRCTDWMEKSLALDKIENKDWDLLCTMVSIVTTRVTSEIEREKIKPKTINEEYAVKEIQKSIEELKEKYNNL